MLEFALPLLGWFYSESTIFHMKAKSESVSARQLVAEWVNCYADELYGWAFAKTNQEELARDLVQDTFVAALENASQFQKNSSPKTWLFGILKNKIAGFYRKQIKLQLVSFSQLEDESSFFDKNGSWVAAERQELISWEEPAGEAEEEAFQIALKNCMDQLPPLWQAALQLKYLEGEKGAAITKDLGISASNYWQIIHRAKLQLRKCLNEKWFHKK